MPSERRGTVTEDIVGYISRLRGSSEWRADKAGNIRAPIAAVGFRLLQPYYFFFNLVNKMHFPLEDIVTNFRHFITSVKHATGNAKDPNADQKLNSGGARPGPHRSRFF